MALWGECTVRTVSDNYTAFNPQTDPHSKVQGSIYCIY